MEHPDNTNKSGIGCVSRRSFLKGGAVVGGTIVLTGIPGMEGKALAAEMTHYPRMLIGRLSELKANKPVKFKYPDDGKNTNSVLVKLGVPAGGGIGSGGDVVAFNALCTHMGGNMSSIYKPADQAMGPCSFHQSTFDLTRHGIIIGGHATESLPQVLLELDNDDIYAVGMIGLIYGRYDNLKG
ncbi:MAG: arsenate reductase (azurin) small subunit [Alphaproteobacteria bacterium]|nr:arsenate reductase (azurin) small subunit [Alphaproteobacteria bacterium]